MADISKVAVGNTTYNIKDATARAGLITFPTSGTPAALGTASNGTATTAARSDHVHAKPAYGKITSAGAITTTATIANGDKLVIVDSSASSVLQGSSVTFDGSTTNTFLSRKGTWERAVGVPDGGTTGQILVKNSDTDGDAGWYSINNIPTDKWYLPTGIQENQVISAYQFVGATSEAKALININEITSYPLSKDNSTTTWSSSSGFYIPGQNSSVYLNGLSNSNLASGTNNVLAAVYGYKHTGSWYSGTSSGTTYTFAPALTISGSTSTYTRILTIRVGGNSTNSNYTKPGIAAGSNEYAYASVPNTSGVLGGNFSPVELYINGTGVSISSSTLSSWSQYTNTTRIFGPIYSNNSIYNTYSNDMYITALVLFSVKLSASQHLELANNITSLGGL